jgi:hypothetical protein
MKKSFILHIDSLGILEKLTTEQRGMLMTAIWKFQTDGVEPEDQLISIVFEPFKNQFIRDREKWEVFQKGQREKGKISAEKRSRKNLKPNTDAANEPSLTSVNQPQPLLVSVEKKPTESTNSVSVNVSVSDSVNGSVSESGNEKPIRALSPDGLEPLEQAEQVHSATNAKKTRTKVQGAGARRPTQQEVEDYFVSEGYSRESGAKAWKYYETADWHDAKGNPVRNWKQKMQAVWFKDENRAKPTFGPGSQQSSPVPTEIFTRYSAQTGMYHKPLQE